MISEYRLDCPKGAYAILLLCAATPIALPAQTFTTLVNFDFSTNGGNPSGVLIQGTDGNFYGTTNQGGVNGFGTIFKMTPAGMLTTLHNFNNTDGASPNGLVQATNGNLYGTTELGGANLCDGIRCGTVFKITLSGRLTTLHSFNGTDGNRPSAGLIQATNGDFYGTTFLGGANGSNGFGTVSKITPSGKLMTLYNFTGGTDGTNPAAGLVQATNGNLYGSTNNNAGGNSAGTIFKITPAGTLTTLIGFDGTDGAGSQGVLIQATNGILYGTTPQGGTTNGYGTIFNITLRGKLVTLYSFCAQSNCTDGYEPFGGLIQGTDSNFYGTTGGGGSGVDCAPISELFGCGTIFTISPAGSLTTLHSFDFNDGASPYTALIQGTDGNFYGTTPYGGSNNNCPGTAGCGTLFSLSVGLGPFIKTLPTSGKIGSAVKILGTNLTGATSVTFDGVPVASFTVNSTGSAISTTLPLGAATGTVQVVTPAGTLSSNVVFRVRP